MTARPFHALLLALLAVALPAQSAYIADTNFSSDGKQTVAFDLDTFKADQALEIFPAPGGGYFVTGVVSTTAQSGIAIGVAKFTAAGGFDTSFDGDGRISIETIFTSLVDVAMDAQGRMVFVGTMAESPGPGTDIVVMRVLPNGSVDGQFGFFGITGAGPNYHQDLPQAVITTPDSHILILRAGHQNGDTTWIPGITVVENDGTSVGNLLIAVSHSSADAPSGAIAWSTQRGRAVIAFEGINVGNCIVRAYEINVFIAGNGSISASNTTVGAYPMPGVSGCSSQVSVQAIAADTSGNLFLAGHIPNVANPGAGNLHGWVMKITAADTLDNTFDGDGVSYQIAPFPLENLRFTSVALDGSGRVLAGGSVGNAGEANVGFAVERLGSSGAADPTFAGGAFLTSYFAGSGSGNAAKNIGRSMLIDNNRVLLAGSRLWAIPVDFDFAIAAWAEPLTAPLIFGNGFE